MFSNNSSVNSIPLSY
ncbi:hypothetical protein E1J05_26405 [Phocaeicola dorei]|nr:hypothetical protein E1J05_26405 [Phocaeicola dorei]